MAKTKNKRKNLSEHVNNKKKSQRAKSLNPFEVHINKEKMRVLGRKLKNDRGLPGVSRAKAINKRKNTLLQEYKLQSKSNRFVDKRIGERNVGLSEEDRAMARFAAIRVRAHKKKSIFNLAEDEVLTHKGQTLMDIEKFDDPRSDDEDSVDGEQSSGKLDAEFVEDAHFGGGVLSRTGVDGAKSHKDLINQLIAESKKRKAEKQQNKEKTLELTEKLDTEWKDLIPIVNKSARQPEEPAKPEIDEYDKVVRELKFETRGHPSDRLKSEDEIAKEEKERLEKLEAERVARMSGVFTERPSASVKHKSADDLDDDFAFDELEPDVTLSYNEKGESNVPFTKESDGVEDPHSEAESEEVETASEDDLSDLKEESSDSDEDEEKRTEIDKDEAKIEVGDRNKRKDEADNEHSSEISDSELDINSVNSSTDSKLNTESAIKPDNNRSKTDLRRESHPSESSYTVSSTVNKIKEDLLKRKEMMEQARKELPYTFKLPDSYEDLEKVLVGQSGEHQSVIIERMIKCNHPSLGQDNKEKIGMLFVYLLQYINDLPSERGIDDCFRIFGCLLPEIFDAAQLNQGNAQSSVIEVIKEKHLDYRKKKKVYPALDVLLFLKMVSCLFPTSDFRHPVVTPCVVFIDQMLHKCRVKNRRDIAYGMFLVTLVVEYTALSKRYLPSALSFLAGMLHMAIPKRGVKLIKVSPPFKAISNTLVLLESCTSSDAPPKLNLKDLESEEIDDDFKVRTLYVCLKLVQEFQEALKEMPSAWEVFKPIYDYLMQIPADRYPPSVGSERERTIEILQKLEKERTLEFIVMKAKKPKALRLYEPNIQKVYDVKKHRVTSREKAEREKLLYKLKKEQKGAMREIRRDRQFLGRVKLKQKIQSDTERREKVKRIFAEASIQQSELNSLDRKKKRKK